MNKEDLLQTLSEYPNFKSEFMKDRKVFLWGPVDDDSAQDIVSRMLYLERQKPGEEIQFFINSPGGVVTSGMVI